MNHTYAHALCPQATTYLLHIESYICTCTVPPSYHLPPALQMEAGAFIDRRTDKKKTEPGIGFSSLSFFTRLYMNNCILFDRVFAWEAVPFEGTAWWKHVPLAMRRRLTFFNIPVSSSRGMLSDPADPLALIRSVAKPADFVVMKIDIDGGPEMDLVHRIAENEAGVALLIDELFFEYHFYFDGLNFGWLTHRGGTNYRKWNHTVDDALGLMRRLRMLGIRAHFWI